MKRVSYIHLFQHGMTFKDYAEMYPGAVLCDENTRKKQGKSMKARWANPSEKQLTAPPLYTRGGPEATKRALSGKTYEEIHGKEEAERLRKLRKESRYWEHSPALGNGWKFSSRKRREDPEFARMLMGAWQHKPSSVETRMGSVLGTDWEYVGDGSFMLEGFCPDFINVNGVKAVVDVHGCYWHCCPQCGYGDIVLPNGFTSMEIHDRDRRKSAAFCNRGFVYIVVWQHEVCDTGTIRQRVDEAIGVGRGGK